MFLQALTDAGIPIHGVSILNTTGELAYPPDWHTVLRADDLVVRVDYKGAATPGDVLRGDDVIRELDITAMRPRPLWSIYDDVKALTVSQQQAIRADLSASQYQKVRALRPPLDGPSLALHWSFANIASATAAEKQDAMNRLAAMVAQQTPSYLMSPPFDPTISIPGDEPAG